jgi:hypothetical protein
VVPPFSFERSAAFSTPLFLTPFKKQTKTLLHRKVPEPFYFGTPLEDELKRKKYETKNNS